MPPEIPSITVGLLSKISRTMVGFQLTTCTIHAFTIRATDRTCGRIVKRRSAAGSTGTGTRSGSSAKEGTFRWTMAGPADAPPRMAGTAEMVFTP